MKKSLSTLFIFTSIFLLTNSALALETSAKNITGDVGGTYGAVAGDVDNDGDLDIYVANYGSQNYLWINDGNANFTASHITGDTANDINGSFGDVNGDGHLDIYVANYGGQNKLWINDGLGNGGASFSLSNITGDNATSSIYGAIGDVDDDGDLDIYVGRGGAGLQTQLWLNDGLGNGGASFSSSNIPGDNVGLSYRASFGDLDGDGDTDIYAVRGVNQSTQNYLWINDGLGNGGTSFTSSNIVGDVGGSAESDLIDIDKDGDLDIYVSNFSSGQNRFWINDGDANFTLKEITGDTGVSGGSGLGDFDHDGDIDIYTVRYGQNKIWINDGSGNFTADNIVGDTGNAEGTIVADFNGDGKLDFYSANYNQQNKLWINNTPDPVVKKKKSSTRRYICSDPTASNYNPTRFGAHHQSYCTFSTKIAVAVPQTTQTTTTESQCFTEYYKSGDTGGEIGSIQTFLTEQGFNPGGIDDMMGPLTLEAIKRFQTTYTNEILTPWGLTSATGRWYQTTRKKANEISGCTEESLTLNNGVVV